MSQRPVFFRSNLSPVLQRFKQYLNKLNPKAFKYGTVEFDEFDVLIDENLQQVADIIF